mmetsp:Transcript_6939/g.14103  ORF Transcript_6939/g.14103 Transcript_6939/m.14103 type:complete len:232 (-) Transcript_6939:736-1431(-)
MPTNVPTASSASPSRIAAECSISCPIPTSKEEVPTPKASRKRFTAARVGNSWKISAMAPPPAPTVPTTVPEKKRDVSPSRDVTTKSTPDPSSDSSNSPTKNSNPLACWTSPPKPSTAPPPGKNWIECASTALPRVPPPVHPETCPSVPMAMAALPMLAASVWRISPSLPPPRGNTASKMPNWSRPHFSAERLRKISTEIARRPNPVLMGMSAMRVPGALRLRSAVASISIC